MDQAALTIFAQFGIGALFAGIVWAAYQKLVTELLSVVRSNTVASERIAATIESNSRTIERLGSVVANIEPRLLELQNKQDRTLDVVRHIRDDRDVRGGNIS